MKREFSPPSLSPTSSPKSPGKSPKSLYSLRSSPIGGGISATIATKEYSFKDEINLGSTARPLRAEPRPRRIMRADGQIDEQSAGANAYNKTHGDAAPQQTDHYGPRQSFGKSNLTSLKNLHPRPFHSGPCPGKREVVDDESRQSVFRRIWEANNGRHGKWSRAKKEKFYAQQDEALFSSKSHDEKFAVQSNRKVWVHLLMGGAAPGGQDKLLTEPPRKTGLHLKHGMYAGRFENVKHKQVICCRKKRNGMELAVDDRPPLDMNLKDDMILRNYREDLFLQDAACDLFRQANTSSCPEMGYYWCNRV